MPNSNGRIYVDKSTDPPKGVSFADVQTVLGTTVDTEGGLCTHKNINMWAKCKPIAANLLRPLDYDHAEQISNYHCGLSVVYSASSFNDFLLKVRSALSNDNYKYRNEFVAVKYDRPEGTMASPFRISDFDGYRHNADLDYSIFNESAGGDGLPISTMYSRNIQIDLRGTPTDVSLPDDSSRLGYYVDWMSGGDKIAERDNLHVLDVISFQLGQALGLKNFRRGMLIMRTDDLNSYRWTSRDIPWATDTEWANLFGSTSGTRVWVIEFYTNVDYAGGAENKNGQFFCIPQFSYITTCITNANFSGSYPASTPFDYIEVFYSCDAPISTFDELYIDLQIEYTSGGTWDRVATIIVKNYSTTDVRAVYENVYGIDSTNRGKYMRIRIYGKLSGSSTTKDFFYSESVIID